MRARSASNPDLATMPAINMRRVRNVLYRKGKTIEILVNYEPACISCRNGGSSFSAKAKARTIKAFIRRLSIFPPTCIPWANLFRKAAASFSKRSLRSRTRGERNYRLARSGYLDGLTSCRQNAGFCQQKSVRRHDAGPYRRRCAEPDRHLPELVRILFWPAGLLL